jgi:hypothetical protein
MLGNPSTHPFSPSAEASRLEGPSHHHDDLGFGEAGSPFNFIERRTIFPRHANDLIFSRFFHQPIDSVLSGECKLP